MKKTFTNLFSTFIVLSIFSSVLTAQNKIDEKRIVVPIRSTNPDGSKNTTTIMKSGEEAQKFDLKKYIEEQTKNNPDAVVEVRDKFNSDAARKNHNRYFNSNNNGNCNTCTTENAQNKGFLGVNELNMGNKLVEGVRVLITRNSGAAKAGLKDDDVILQLNKAPINSFRDISTFMRTTKSGDKVEIVYEHDGTVKTTTAILGQSQEAWSQNKEQEKEACLGVYSSSHAVEGQSGAIIQDFTPVSAAQEVAMERGDMILSVNGVRVKSYQDVWDEIAKYKPKEKVRVSYLRDKEPKQVIATLKACKPRTNDENIILVPKAGTANAVLAPNQTNLGLLELTDFSVSPNPTTDMAQIKFQGAAVPTNIAFYDLTGKLLYLQNITDFNGDYNQRFDLTEFAKGVVVVKIQQNDKVFSTRLVVN